MKSKIASIFALSTLAFIICTSYYPLHLGVYIAGLSLATFMVYAIDKRAAIKGHWRTSERSLQLFSLLGGWPGALLAQKTLRHKIQKKPFLIVFWVCTASHIAALFILFNPLGKSAIQVLQP